VTNSSIQILLKQHSAAIDQIGEVFYLSDGEKQLLLSASKGEGIFFAGQNHVAIQIIASADEHNLITSNPEDILKKQSFLSDQKPNNGMKPPIKPIETKPFQNPLTPPEVSKPFPNPSLDRAGQINSMEIKPKVEVVPKINIPEIKTVEIENKIPVQNPSVPAAAGPAPFNPPSLKATDGQSKMEPLTTIEIKEKPMVVPPQNTSSDKEIEMVEVKPEMKTESVLFKRPEVVVVPNEIKIEESAKQMVNEIKKPIFIKTEEQRIPQPPQLARKPQPVFDSNPSVPVATSPLDKGDNKMDYDKLFGDGIV